MSPENRLTVFQPYDGAEIETLDYAPWPEVDAMLDRATSAFADRTRRLPAHGRVEILRRLAVLLRDQREAFALLIAREGGKPLGDARIEADRAVIDALVRQRPGDQDG